MRTVTVVLDGKVFVVEELRSRDNGAWRKRLEEHFEELAEAVEGAPGVDVTDGKELGKLVRAVGGKLLRSVDLVRELVEAYDPALVGPMDEAFDSEILDAFAGVLSLAYPFGVVVERVRKFGAMLPGM